MYFMHYDYLRFHQTLRVAPALAGGVTKQLSSMQDVIAMIEGMRSAGQLIVAVPRFHFQVRRRLLFFLCQQLQQSATLVLICRFRQKLSKFSYVLLTDKLLHAIAPGHRGPMLPCAFCECLSNSFEKVLHRRTD